jgi:O-antigen ligase
LQSFSRLDVRAKIALALFTTTFWWSSAFVSLHPEFSVPLALAWIIHILFGAALFHSIEEISEESVGLFAFVLASGLALFGCVIAYHFLFVPKGMHVALGMLGWGSSIPGFISLRLFGAFCGAVLATVLLVVWRADNRGEREWWHYPAVAVTAGMMIWSGTRAAVLGVIVGLLLVAFGYGMRMHWGFAGRLTLCVAAGAVGAWLLIPYGDTYFLLLAPEDNIGASDIATGGGGRVSMWAAMLRVFSEHPLLGTGGGSSAWLAPPGMFPHLQPHNAFVQFLLTWGLVGALPAFYLFGRATLAVHRICRNRHELLPILAMLDTLLFMSLLDGMLYFPRFVMLIIICYATIFAAAREGRAPGA